MALVLVACEGGPAEQVAAGPGSGSPGTRTPTATAAAEYESPFAYCGQTGSVDNPGAPYVGPEHPPEVFRVLADLMGLPSDAPERTVTPEFEWRCMDGFVYACTYGANLPCGKADLSSRPTREMVEFCSRELDGTPLPGSLVGHQTIYGWLCRGDTPATTHQKYQVDARGFVVSFWHWIPEPESEPERSPAAGQR
ncbi:MAG: hypothetical protein M0R73_08275 [Dehalococcoidia bacterium]|nr:hypothetical protein [Dehalococcoidia bacterium]